MLHSWFSAAGSNPHQMVSKFSWMFQPWTMTSSSWQLSSGGQSTTWWTMASSTEFFYGVITTMLFCLLPLSVLSWFSLLFHKSLVFWTASHSDCAGNLLHPTSQKTAKGFKHAIRTAYLKLFLSRCASSQCCIWLECWFLNVMKKSTSCISLP